MKLAYTAGFGSMWQSLPVRGAWIEIIPREKMRVMNAVAPRAGSVD